ncbi:MAG TPA: hypothetical protein VJQ52_22650 [Steroidobacteraceae bacterium]|nr:hypothetical protein [Steroidobacteraceae bacterium]
MSRSFVFSARRSALAASIALALGMCGPSSADPAAAAASSKAHPNFSGIWERTARPMKELAPAAFNAAALKALNPTLTPGEKSWAEHGIGTDDANCHPRRQPWMLEQSVPVSIVHDGDKMVLIYEKRSAPMHVYIGRAAADPAKVAPSLNGYSVGRWEGDELVVDSVGFMDRPGHGSIKTLPFRPTTRITQRFSLARNGDELKARVTITEPEFLEKPYVYDYTWRRLPYATNYALVELCDARDPDRLKY